MGIKASWEQEGELSELTAKEGEAPSAVIPVGQLVVDIGDAKSKKLLWMANASDTLNDNPDKNTKKINSVVEKMFKKSPPPPAK